MEKFPVKESSRKPFSTRAAVSALIWIGLMLALAAGGLFAWMLPARSEREILGERLPSPDKIATTDGEIIADGRYVSGRRTYFRPRAKFLIDGREFAVESVNGYAEDLLPSYPQPGAVIGVVYLRSDPSNAWFAWEYDRLRADSSSPSAGRFGEIVRKYYLAASIIIAAASGLFLLVNLFVPVVALLTRVRTRR